MSSTALRHGQDNLEDRTRQAHEFGNLIDCRLCTQHLYPSGGTASYNRSISVEISAGKCDTTRHLKYSSREYSKIQRAKRPYVKTGRALLVYKSNFFVFTCMCNAHRGKTFRTSELHSPECTTSKVRYHELTTPRLKNSPVAGLTTISSPF
jgi:DNA-directed RNA polymerase subunit M/transcription elongation factor TFIIS